MIENQKLYYPPMHTAEHILNQTMIRMFGVERSFSNHIERKKSKCDYHFHRNLTENEITALQNEVNKVINTDLAVIAQVVPFQQAMELVDLRNFDTAQPESIRLVSIGNYDICPCSGNHVEQTGQIGGFIISSVSYENNVLRIRFKLNEPI